jgi:ABC-2 type transport system permease protein/sodium transport system permease protein
MTITAHSTGLAASLFGGGMTLDVVIKVLLLLVLFAAFFSAILLAITSCARSFKEAQAYIIPLMLLCLVPGVLCLMPSLEFKTWMAVTPLVNIVMLARDLLEGSAAGGLAIAAVCSTIFYIAAAIALAARIFGTDAILYGSQATWSDLVRRPIETKPMPTVPMAMLCLAVIFPSVFVLGNNLARSQDLSMSQRLEANALVLALIFGALPILFCLYNRVRLSTGLALRRPTFMALLGALILGPALWPAAHESLWLTQWLELSNFSLQRLEAAKVMLQQLQTVPLPLVLITLAIVPAIAEEICFRGYLVGALRTRLAGWPTIAATALLFGVFHEVLAPGRLLPSTLLGVALGWVRLRTGSIWPGMLMHATINGLVLTIGVNQGQLTAIRPEDVKIEHVPLHWHAVALAAFAIGVSLFIATRPPSTEPIESSPNGR